MDTREQHVGMQVKRVADLLVRISNESMDHTGLTRSQVLVLFELDCTENKTLSSSQLKERLDVAQPTTWGLVNRLEAKGMVRTFIDPTDARAKLISMTEEGQRAYAMARVRMMDTEAMLLEGLDEAEVDQLKSYLSHLYENCNRCMARE